MFKAVIHTFFHTILEHDLKFGQYIIVFEQNLTTISKRFLTLLVQCAACHSKMEGECHGKAGILSFIALVSGNWGNLIQSEKLNFARLVCSKRHNGPKIFGLNLKKLAHVGLGCLWWSICLAFSLVLRSEGHFLTVEPTLVCGNWGNLIQFATFIREIEFCVLSM